MKSYSTGAVTPEQRQLLLAAVVFWLIKDRKRFASKVEYYLSRAGVAVRLSGGVLEITPELISKLPSIDKIRAKLAPVQQLQSGCEVLWSPRTRSDYNRAGERQRALMIAGMSPTIACKANPWRAGYSLTTLKKIKGEMSDSLVQRYSKTFKRSANCIAWSFREKQALMLVDWALDMMPMYDARPMFITVNLKGDRHNQNTGKKRLDRIEKRIRALDSTARLEGSFEVGEVAKGAHTHIILFTALAPAQVRKVIEGMRIVKEGSKAIKIKPVVNINGLAFYITKTFVGDGRAMLRRIKKPTSQ